MTENQKSSEIVAAYTTRFKIQLERYIDAKAHRPKEEMVMHTAFMRKLGLLTEVWVVIEKLMKEKYYDRTRKSAD